MRGITEAISKALDTTFQPIEIIAHRAGHGSYGERDDVMNTLNRLASGKHCLKRNIGGRAHFRILPKVVVR